MLLGLFLFIQADCAEASSCLLQSISEVVGFGECYQQNEHYISQML